MVVSPCFASNHGYQPLAEASHTSPSNVVPPLDWLNTQKGDAQTTKTRNLGALSTRWPPDEPRHTSRPNSGAPPLLKVSEELLYGLAQVFLGSVSHQSGAQHAICCLLWLSTGDFTALNMCSKINILRPCPQSW